MGVPINTFNPGMLGQQAIGATQTGSWLNTIGTGLGTVSNAIAGGYQARVAANNAKLATEDQQNALSAGQTAAEEEKIKTGSMVASEKVAQAANNLDVNSGSPLAVRQSTQKVGDLDAALIQYNAARTAYGYGIQAADNKAQSHLLQLAGAFNTARGSMNTYASYISGSTALKNQQLGFGAAGVPS